VVWRCHATTTFIKTASYHGSSCIIAAPFAVLSFQPKMMTTRIEENINKTLENSTKYILKYA
jgi:hypothetical protein